MFKWTERELSHLLFFVSIRMQIEKCFSGLIGVIGIGVITLFLSVSTHTSQFHLRLNKMRKYSKIILPNRSNGIIGAHQVQTFLLIRACPFQFIFNIFSRNINNISVFEYLFIISCSAFTGDYELTDTNNFNTAGVKVNTTNERAKQVDKDAVRINDGTEKFVFHFFIT